MAGIKGNRRVIYTRKVIQDSFFELINEKDIHKITVTDICKKADINRGTFYAHYKDAYDLLDKMESDFFEQAYNFVKSYDETSLLNVLYLIKENKDLSKIIFCRQIASSTLNKIFNVAARVDIESIINNTDKIYIDYLIKYSVGGILAIIQSWIENEFKEKPEVILNIINKVQKG